MLLIGIWGIISVAAGEPTFFRPMFPFGIWALVLISSLFDQGKRKRECPDDGRAADGAQG